MKKKIILLIISLVLLLPLYVNAQIESKGLKEIVLEEKIESNLIGYEENEDQAIVYLFRGNGCGYCHAFISFLNDIYPSYGKYFKVVSYEVWYNEDNSKLMNQVGKVMDEDVQGVPFIVIGDKVFGGYAESWNDEIKAAIKNLYDTDKNKRYDVMNKLNMTDIEKETERKAKEKQQEEELNTYKTKSKELEEKNNTLSRTNSRSKVLLIIMGIVTGLVIITAIVLIIIFANKLKNKNKK